MASDSPIEALSSDECRAYLASSRIGRVAVSSGALPAIYTVLFALRNGRVVLRVAPKSRLHQALCQAVVAFSIDHLDEDAQEGWSVLVQGIGEEVTDADLADTDLADSLRSLPLPSWSDSPEGDRFVWIPLDLLSGTRVRWDKQSHPAPDDLAPDDLAVRGAQ